MNPALCLEVESDGSDLSGTSANIVNSINRLNEMATNIKSNLPRDAEVPLDFLLTPATEGENLKQKMIRLRGDIKDFELLVSSDAIDGIVHNTAEDANRYRQNDPLQNLVGYLNVCDTHLKQIDASDPQIKIVEKLDEVRKISSARNGMTSACLHNSILTQVQKFCKQMKAECKSLPEKLPEDPQNS